ncbi:D-glycero-beta-D-manno-heptose-1,7-bisphosphate 7-phosphatase [Halioglobus japonicus]|uniref:D,D-heptose 1,7-bisphosphate phosphatase n=1 Tax=Halioglobus japonicus TaxID=930805 RepID=A0AAP8MCF7_9GAMM|nr:D-glycero-beta-D-manno-heptose 1,7-bisphosphate 7-phosphatase [Halioglobus japonicus]AQA17319.1 D-glycero-beta-D-manno-heptose-1,7-bisphosphate 7-phosphatase [Halioglobus japonicus]PLW85243.1 D-glycero-beta-D-manno-heptose-1,7-bisphosphate 7-phosphatase [Halioglobus japonicus]GHD24124.1 D-glycero-beta-D-manno-heptose-1,7-bisphosphate 7-phosphatase [Halioglobus japonicus]
MSLLVLDRDGVVNHDSDDYIRSLQDWQPIPGSIEAIARACQAGLQVAIATNQSGLSRGYFTLDTLEEIHQHLCQLVEEQGGSIAGIFYCPHLPNEGCDCRKPGTGLLKAMEAELGQSASGAWFIGDSLKDLQAGRAHGCRPALVTTGKGEKTRQQLASPDVAIDAPADIPIYDDLASAIDAILSA